MAIKYILNHFAIVKGSAKFTKSYCTKEEPEIKYNNYRP